MAAAAAEDNSGSFIPASQRPDGSWRKARRVKDGYTPQEEVPLYESKGKQWASRAPSYPPGLDPKLIQAKEASSEAKKKKKKNANSVINSAPTGVVTSRDMSTNHCVIIEEKWERVGKSKGGSKEKEAKPKEREVKPKEKEAPNLKQETDSCDPVKRLRNLKKKLKEIVALEEKINSKHVKNPDKDQLSKVARKEELETAILELELDISLNIKN